MGIIFVEYKVIPEKREAYLQWIDARSRSDSSISMELYEGSDQPDLFVELWRDFNEEAYRAFKKTRLESADSPWAELANYVPGGAAKIHIWHFHRSVRNDK